VMYEVDVEALNFGGEVIPLIDLLLLLSPVVSVGPNLVQLGRPLCGKTVSSPCAFDNILCRDSGIFDLAVISFDFGIRNVYLERSDLRRHFFDKGFVMILAQADGENNEKDSRAQINCLGTELYTVTGVHIACSTPP
jgi:hypothetical protein